LQWQTHGDANALFNIRPVKVIPAGVQYSTRGADEKGIIDERVGEEGHDEICTVHI
jgi:hypothetical protein